MSMSTAERQMIQLAIAFVCLISSSFEAKTKSGAQLRTQQSLADSAICGNDEKKAVNNISVVCASEKWPDLTEAKDKCCFGMNAVCAPARYIRGKCKRTPKSSKDFEQRVKDLRNAALADCAQHNITWSESLCGFGEQITGDCLQYKSYLDCKDVYVSSVYSNGLSLRYPAVTELLLVALLIKYFI